MVLFQGAYHLVDTKHKAGLKCCGKEGLPSTLSHVFQHFEFLLMRAKICSFHTVSFAFHDICELFIV